MPEPRYFVIRATPDGTTVGSFDREALTKRLEEGYYGKGGFLDRVIDPDTGYWDGQILIIRGDVVVPKITEVIKRYRDEMKIIEVVNQFDLEDEAS